MTTEIAFNDGAGMVRALIPKFTPKIIPNSGKQPFISSLPEILFITSYPPRECGIATYSQDLFKALDNKFKDSFSLKVCALESGVSNYVYPDEVKLTLDTTNTTSYNKILHTVNNSKDINLVLLQHEFGFFEQAEKGAFLQFLNGIVKPVVIAFHTVLPHPDDILRAQVRHISTTCAAIIVMTKHAARILCEDYGILADKIVVIAHGTHLVPHLNNSLLKEKYGLTDKKVLATFGLLSSGKGIETTLSALPAIVETNPNAMFLVIGKTHPSVVQSEGEQYRETLEAQVEALGLQPYVKFINRYLPLQDLLEYLQLTDIYLFTSKDPHQAVSGTFSYAMSCACPIISTPIPHAREVLRDDTGIIVDFQHPQQLAEAVNRLLGDEQLRQAFSSNTLQRIVPTAWENSAIAHALLLQKIAGPKLAKDFQIGYYNGFMLNLPEQDADKIALQYRLPEIDLDHVKKMTTVFGMIQFSMINQPDMESGYTLDDNARALIAFCMHYEITGDDEDLHYIRLYLNFIRFCQQPEGYFLNYVDLEKQFTTQNNETNLADSNGRAIWALGYLISKRAILPKELIESAETVFYAALPRAEMMHSTRAMAFAIKGLYYCNLTKKSPENSDLIKTLANRIVQMYHHEAEPHWEWYESYLTYANSILPEAMLCAWQDSGNSVYKAIAKSSFDFLLSRTFNEHSIKVISNRTWLQKGAEAAPHGEQPIDVAYTILALKRFHTVFELPHYAEKLSTAFNWFLGANHLHQIVYNPCTGGCYDGLEENAVNLNQGAESTLSYLMARLIIEKQLIDHNHPKFSHAPVGFEYKN